MSERTENRRILIVDDQRAIHDDFHKVLERARDVSLDALEGTLFATAPATAHVTFELASAFQGQEAVDRVRAAKAAGTPYALAFVDMRMPPGWDGLQTIERIWQVDSEIQIVICSAYSDYPWSELRARLGDRDSLLIIQKPFDPIEILQCAHALTAKWSLSRAATMHVDELRSGRASSNDRARACESPARRRGSRTRSPGDRAASRSEARDARDPRIGHRTRDRDTDPVHRQQRGVLARGGRSHRRVHRRRRRPRERPPCDDRATSPGRDRGPDRGHRARSSSS